MAKNSLEVVFLLLLPKHLAEAAGTPDSTSTPKEVPNFFYHDIEFRTLSSEKVVVEKQPVRVKKQILDERIWLAECRYTLERPFDKDAIRRKETIEASLRRRFLAETEPDYSLYEEYSIFLIDSSAVRPETYLETHAGPLSQLLFHVEKPLGRLQRERALSKRVRYSAEDIIIVDWNGAIAFDPDSDFQADIDLFKIAGYQLLRYRLLNQMIDDDLRELNFIVRSRKLWFPRRRAQLMHEIVKRRLSLLLDFERVDQSLLQIGDWYPSQLYRAIADELYLAQWKTIVSDKLDNLRDIRSVITEELTISWDRLWDLVQLIGWLILLLGYFVLFFFDVRAAS